MTTFTNFTDPYRSTAAPASRPRGFDGGDQVAALDEQEFTLLMRTVELVVQAGAYSRPRLQGALRISVESSKHLTHLLEQVGVISMGDPEHTRAVLVTRENLPMLLTRLLITRDTVPALSAVA
jgi:hypothetical protein